MTTITAFCIIFCTLICSVFIFFTIVYLSELKRERTLRKMMLDANDKVHDLLVGGKVPVVMVDIPTNQAQDNNVSANKDKKSVN